MTEDGALELANTLGRLLGGSIGKIVVGFLYGSGVLLAIRLWGGL